MRAHVNDFLRSIVGCAVRVFGLVWTCWLRFRLRSYSLRQERLKKKYAITCDTPVLPYGPAVAQAIYDAAFEGGRTARFAKTSGSDGLLARRCDELLSGINCEYKSKRGSGRLGPIECIDIHTKDFAEGFADNGNWETQFKFLPLYRRMHSLTSKRVL